MKIILKTARRTIALTYEFHKTKTKNNQKYIFKHFFLKNRRKESKKKREERTNDSEAKKHDIYFYGNLSFMKMNNNINTTIFENILNNLSMTRR